MGSFLFFLVLAIVSLTGRAAASSHAARRRMLLEAPEKIEMQELFDEKQALRDSLQDDGESSPSLPMFRIRRTPLGSGALGLLEDKLKGKKENEDIAEKRRKLKESLRVIIPSGTARGIRPRVSEIPPSFNFYAENYNQKTCGKARSPTAMRGRNPASTKVLGASASGVQVPSGRVITSGPGSGMRPRGLARVGVGLLRVERMETQWRTANGFITDVV